MECNWNSVKLTKSLGFSFCFVVYFLQSNSSYNSAVVRVCPFKLEFNWNSVKLTESLGFSFCFMSFSYRETVVITVLLQECSFLIGILNTWGTSHKLIADAGIFNTIKLLLVTTACQEFVYKKFIGFGLDISVN